MKWLNKVLVVFLLCGSVIGCSRPSKKKCEEACWHQAKLVYWELAEAEIAKAPEPEQAKTRADLQAKWDALVADTENPQPKVCTEMCTKQGRQTEVDCIIKAKTAKAAKACTE